MKDLLNVTAAFHGKVNITSWGWERASVYSCFWLWFVAQIQHQDLYFWYFGDQSAHPCLIKHLSASEQKIQPHHIIPVMFILSTVSVVILTVLLTVRSDRVEVSCLSLVCRCCRHALLLLLSLPAWCLFHHVCLPSVVSLRPVAPCWLLLDCWILHHIIYVVFTVLHLPKIQWSEIHNFPLTCSGLKVLNHKMEILKRHKPAVSQLTQIQANNSHSAP